MSALLMMSVMIIQEKSTIHEFATQMTVGVPNPLIIMTLQWSAVSILDLSLRVRKPTN